MGYYCISGLLVFCFVGFNCAQGQASSNCTDGQVFKQCGSACNVTCDTPDPICTANCVPRCECPQRKPVYFNRTCIERTKCPANTNGSCLRGQIFKKCGSACDKTCNNPNPICTRQCVPKCECPSKRPLLFNGTCVERTKCPGNTNTTCPHGQIFKQCGSACDKTCDIPNPICTQQCVPKCECPSKRPLLFNGTCVERTKCPGNTNGSCLRGQIFKQCGSACDKTCANPNPICTEQCVAKCECPSKRPLLFNGTCVERTKCPGNTNTTCSRGQIFKKCGSACDKTCNNPNPICTQQCVPKCECPSKRPLLFNGTCVERTKCPGNRNTTCPFGQVFNSCGSACNRTCEDPTPRCTKQCVARCECPRQRPYLFNGTCLERARCPDNRNRTCPFGQVFNSCGSACNRTCEDPTPRCTKQCVARCECPRQRPYLFNGTCLVMERCPANRRCDNSYSPMDPYVNKVFKTCNQCKWVSWFKYQCQTVDCSHLFSRRKCCPGYLLIWNKCKVPCGGCSNVAVRNQDACRPFWFSTNFYCCAGFRLTKEGGRTRCIKE